MINIDEIIRDRRNDNHILNTEIYAISEFLYRSNRNLWGYQKMYLQYKLFDLIHSYLLNLRIIYGLYYQESGKKHSDLDKVNENLNNCDYSIQSNRDLIQGLEITTQKNVIYWYDVPNSEKIDKIIESIE